MAEFMQKIFQVKEIAAQQGKWPATLPNPNSKACDGARWQYSVATDGTMSLTLKNPETLSEHRTAVISSVKLPYTYSDRLPIKTP
jgi:hypothetical protein